MNQSLIKNDRLLRALLRQPVDQTPVWLMRQAGRYLPEYREVRAKAGDFMTLCQTPELACEVTLQPLRRFPLDAAIIFSDILTIPDAMGLGLHFIEGEGPRFHKPITDLNDIKKLHVPDMAQLDYVMQAIRLVKQALNQSIPLIGFCGSPWTMACYMLENGSSKDFSKIKKLLFTEPTHLHHLLNILAETAAHYLNLQIKAGADVVMIFDTWGGVLTTRDYQEFSLNYMTKIIQQIKQPEDRRVPIIIFTKNGGQWLELMAESQCDAIGIDWTINIGNAKKRVGDRVALQGNMDPTILFSTPERVKQEAISILKDYGNSGTGHVFNLGHGILPTIPPENVAALIEAVHNHSKR